MPLVSLHSDSGFSTDPRHKLLIVLVQGGHMKRKLIHLSAYSAVKAPGPTPTGVLQ